MIENVDKYFVASIQTMSHDITFMQHWKLCYTLTGKLVDAAIDLLLV